MARPKPQTSLLDDVLTRAVRATPGFPPWYERLPQEAREELEAVRAAYDPSIHQKTTYAKAVIAAARERGWEICGPQGGINWLVGKR